MSQPQVDLLSEDEQNLLYKMINMEQMGNFIEDDSILSNHEDIKDIIFTPNSTVLSKEQYAGPYDFQVIVDNQNNTNNCYMYSDDLNKVYTKMSFPIQVGFRLNSFPQEPLLIRATPVYSQPQHAQECVYRCINHAYSDKEVEEHVRQHILRCNNPLAQYLGSKMQNERLSVLIPLSQPQTGTDLVMEMFHFVCQNSCPTPGMNRRHIQIIFTLESPLGEICGRQTFNVRVCCSPKRDMMKEVKEFNETNLVSRGKKRKVEKTEKETHTNPNEVDTEEYRLTLPIIGKQNVQYVLKYCQDLMAGEMVKHKNHDMMEIFKKCHEEISTLKKQPVE